MILYPASKEQEEIVKMAEGNNLKVEAVAGAGKTTTFLHISLRYQARRWLLLTYNARLKEETRERVKRMGIQNMEVHSYHALCTKYFSSSCHTDNGIRAFLSGSTVLRPKKAFPEFHGLMIDECQDMKPLYFELIKRIHKEIHRFNQFILVGDPKQNIFEYDEADARFLTLSPRLFGPLSLLEWKSPVLKESFRLNEKTAHFLNECVFKRETIRATRKDGKKPVYLICDIYKHTEFIFNRIQKFVHENSVDDVFIIAPSIRSQNSPVRQLANRFTKDGIPIFIPLSDEEKLDQDVLNGKIVFSSFHQVKGLERKCVVVFGFDESYFTFFARHEDRATIPNALYVAITRAREELILLHSHKYPPLSFLEKDKLETFTEKIELSKLNVENDETLHKISEISATQLIRHLPDIRIEEALKFVDIEKIHDPTDSLSIPTKTTQNELVESVADINGTAIPLYFSYSQEEFRDWRRIFSYLSPKMIPNLEEITETLETKIKDNTLTISDMIQFSILLNASQTGVYFKTRQISVFDWIPNQEHERCQSRLKKKFYNKNATNEFIIQDKQSPRRPLVGYIDRIDEDSVWELKCVAGLTGEHKLQLAVYMYLYEQLREKIKTFLDKPWTREFRVGLETIISGFDPSIKKVAQRVFDELEFKEGQWVGEWVIKKIMVKKKTFRCQRRVVIGKKQEEFTFQQLVKIMVQTSPFKEWIGEIREKIEKGKTFRLWNILNEEEYQISSSLERLTQMIEYLMETKFGKQDRLTDEQFLIKLQKPPSVLKFL